MPGSNKKKIHSLIPYFGGKSRVAEQIIKLFPAHRTYAEVFAGGLSVLLAKNPSKNEVVNDFDTELANLYKIAKFRLGELCEAVEHLPASRQIWTELLATDPTYLNDVYRALRKIYLLRLSYGGRGQHFGADKKNCRFKAPQLKMWLEEFWERTAKVTVECLDAVHFVQNYDSPETFFYLDPVYFGKDAGYIQQFGGLDRHERLRDALAATKGKWLLSHHDCPEARELYKGFKVRLLEVPYTVHGAGRTRTKELLISNY